MKRLTLSVVAANFLFVCGCGDKMKWQEFKSPDGQFSVQLPGEPKTQTQTVEGLTLKMHMVELKNGAYGVGYTDLPPGKAFSYAGAVTGMANSNGGTVTKESDWKFEGTTGKEVEMKITKPRSGYASARIVVVGNRMYEVIAIGTSTSLDNADVKKMFNSFKITK